MMVLSAGQVIYAHKHVVKRLYSTTPSQCFGWYCTTSPIRTGTTCHIQCATGYTPPESVTGGG